MQLEMTLNNNLSLEQDPFSTDALPVTMCLARKYGRKIYPILPKFPKEWSYEDKVLAMLLPSITEKIIEFHNSKGNKLPLNSLYGQNLLEQLDDQLCKILSEKLACL